MQLYRLNLGVRIRNDGLIVLGTLLALHLLLLESCNRSIAEPDRGMDDRRDESVADSHDAATGDDGPTLRISYRKENFIKNPIGSFMYFVPLIAPTLVDNISSVNNEQQIAIISNNIKVSSTSFLVTCEFEISGSGFHMNTFDPNGMIAVQTDELKKGEKLTNMLDYIKLDGDGCGRIEVKGQIADSVKTVTEVEVQFNARGHKSPVTIGLYDIKPEEGEYKYENRSNEVVAQVNTLIFKKAEETPRMGIEIASLTKKGASAGILEIIKGSIANLFIKPLKVDKLGNTTMLEFGDALLQKKTTFTFPKAKNIKESKVVEIEQPSGNSG